MNDNFEEIKKWDNFSKFHVLNSTNYLISKLNHKKNLVVVDVGANSGTFFDLLFEGLDIERAVLFEPHPKLYGYLTKKYENNKNIVVENIALSDSIRPYNLNVGAFEYNIENNLNNDSYNLGLSYVDFDNHSDTETNYFDNLKDRYHLDRIDLLKIDTETEDLFVLKGFTETIKNLKSKPIIELENNWWMKYSLKESQELLDNFCSEAGYINNVDLNVRGDFYLFPIENEFGVIQENKLQTKNSNITIVTGLWDLGRGDMNGWGKRDFQHYKDRFFELLETDFQLCIWIPNELEEEVLRIRGNKPTKIFIKNVEDFEVWNPFFNDIQKIRENTDWKNFAGWLSDSPQAALKYYNPMMFTKFFMLNDSAIVNPFNSDYFFWIDGGLTNTVSKGYFTHDNVLNNLENYVRYHNDKFIQISYPYDGNSEIHGFERKAMARYCNTDYVNYVCRGGFFGGSKDKVHQMNEYYYSVMHDTLKEGLMGADECLFTILSYKYKDIIHRFEIEGNGLVWPFFEELKKYTKDFVQNNKPKTNTDNVALYVITFNSPDQFEVLIKSMLDYDPDFINKTKKYLLNNSTDLTTTQRYVELCEKFGFEHIKKDNIGIVGGRIFVADHFDKTNYDYYFWFEDDMAFYLKKNETCKNGFNRWTNNLYSKSLEIIQKENFDFLKLNYTEFFGDNGTQWSWYNVPQDFRQRHWPDNPKLPQQGLEPNSPKTKFENIKSHKGLPYVTGEVYVCNWPIIVSREGNYKCFLETRWAHPFEQTVMSYVYQETVMGNIKPGLLLLTPTEHNRFDHYDGSLRKES